MSKLEQKDLRILITAFKKMHVMYNYNEEITFYFGKFRKGNGLDFIIGIKDKNVPYANELTVLFSEFFKKGNDFKRHLKRKGIARDLKKKSEEFIDLVETILTYTCSECEIDLWSGDVCIDELGDQRCSDCDLDNGVYKEERFV